MESCLEPVLYFAQLLSGCLPGNQCGVTKVTLSKVSRIRLGDPKLIPGKDQVGEDGLSSLSMWEKPG